MRKKLLLASLLVGCYSISFAQTQEVNPTKSYKHDIGFNTTFLFDGVFNSSSTPFTLMYKIYSVDNKAIRLGLNVNANIHDTGNASTSSYYSNSSNADIALSVGKEFQHAINQKWIFYSGGDIAPFFSLDNYDQFQSNQKISISNYSSFGVRLRPFLGLRYNINSRLYVAAEASLQLQYGHNKNYIKNITQNRIDRDTNSNNFNMSMSPASGLFIFYRF